MKKVTCFAVVLSVLGNVMLSGCGNGDGGSFRASNQESELIGTWNKENGNTNIKRITFYENGNCDISGDVGIWSVSKNKISILNPEDYSWSSDSMMGTFSVKDDTLRLTDVGVLNKRSVSVEFEPELIYRKE